MAKKKKKKTVQYSYDRIPGYHRNRGDYYEIATGVRVTSKYAHEHPVDEKAKAESLDEDDYEEDEE
jgi:hypothetical protein